MKKLLCLLAVLLLPMLGYLLLPASSLYGFATGVEQGLAGLEQRSVEVQGHQWKYLVSDDGEGEPLLLLHGFGADANNWVRLSHRLGDHYRIIAPDLLGFGDSDRPTDAPYDIASQAQRALAFADAIGLEQFDLAGSSMGGFIAGAMTVQQPERVRSLWLLAPGGVLSAPNSEMFDMILQQGSNPLIIEQLNDFDFTWDFIFSEPPFLPSRLRQGFAERQLQRVNIYQQIFDALRSETVGIEQRLRESSVPTLIVWGEQDRVLHPSGGPILAAAMADASLITLPNMGHLPMLESPAKTAELYLEWRSDR